MKNYGSHSNFFFSKSFILRTPSLPFNIDDLDKNTLSHFYDNDFIKEAIYIASPVLCEELHKDFDSKTPKEKDKLLLSFYKYYSRMQSRCTPYGLFAACSTGNFESESNISLYPVNSNMSFYRHTRPDMNFLCAFAQKLVTNTSIRPHLKFYPNNSIYQIGDQFRYVEYRYINNRRVHQITSVNFSEYLQKVFMEAESGSTIRNLVCALVSEEINKEEASEFINELISSQLLVSELEPAITGNEFTYQLIDRLILLNEKVNSSEITEVIDNIKNLQIQLDNFDKSLINKTHNYKSLFSELKKIETSIEENQLFQIDLYKNSKSCKLNKNVQSKLLRGIQFLNRAIPSFENPSLKKFKENFSEKYEDEEVPLLQVLDTESGIGYLSKDLSGTSELIDDLIIEPKNTTNQELQWTKWQEILSTKLINALRNGDHILHLSDNDIKDIDYTTNKLPFTVPIVFRVLDNQDKIFIQNCGGSSASTLLGRFAHGDNTVKEIINEIVEFEQAQAPEKVFAEIVHLPESRLGNILLRPIFREFEIPYLASSAVDKNHQIELKDLYLSLRNNYLVLRSKTLNKEVIPRLSTAHNYSFNALPVYQFLCDLQSQYFERRVIGFDWGSTGTFSKFRPRVEYEGIVLSAATWNFNKLDFKDLHKSQNIDTSIINEWRNLNKLPRRVFITEADNELIIDFENDASASLFLDMTKKREQIILTEFLFDLKNPRVKDIHDNGYTNEFISVLYIPIDPNTISNTNIPSLPDNKVDIQRTFYPGSEWIYYKFYCGIKSADKILTGIIKPMIIHLQEKFLINDWFFIRYHDQDWHIRLRLHTDSLNNIGSILDCVKNYVENYQENGIIYKTVIDTYKRELERYGYQYIALTEKFFCIDSEAVLKFLDLIDFHNGNKLRWQFSARSIDDLLNAFELDDKSKLNFMESLKTSFFKEHGDSTKLKIQLDNKFRNLRKDIEFAFNFEDMKEFEEITGLLEIKNKKLKPLIDELLRLSRSNLLPIDLANLFGSYIHMMLNRIFYSRQRTHEMVVYDLLYRHYKSKVARSEKTYTQLIESA